MEQRNIEQAANLIVSSIVSHLSIFWKFLDKPKLKLMRMLIEKDLTKLALGKIIYSFQEVRDETSLLGKVLKSADISPENIHSKFGIEVSLNNSKDDVIIIVGDMNQNKIFTKGGLPIYPK